MAVICKECAVKKQIPREALPPVRVRKAPCDFCGDDKEAGGRNYDIPDHQVPGHRTNLDTIAEREEMEARGSSS